MKFLTQASKIIFFLLVMFLLSTLSAKVLATEIPSFIKPGFKAVLIPGQPADKYIYLKYFAASPDHPEGFIFFDCEDGTISAACPKVMAQGRTVTAKALINSELGFWNEASSYTQAFLKGILVISAASQFNWEVNVFGGFVNVFNITPLDALRRENMVGGALRTILKFGKESDLKKDNQLVTANVATDFDSMLSGLRLTLLDLEAREQHKADQGKGHEYDVWVAEHKHVQEIFKPAPDDVQFVQEIKQNSSSTSQATSLSDEAQTPTTKPVVSPPN
jgi:hypothetical protein